MSMMYDSHIHLMPGLDDTPEIFRKAVLMRQGIEERLMLGIDSSANGYDVEMARYIIGFDCDLLCRVMPAKYGGYKGFLSPEMEKLAPEELNPFRKTWENASTRNMLKFIEPW